MTSLIERLREMARHPADYRHAHHAAAHTDAANMIEGLRLGRVPDSGHVMDASEGLTGRLRKAADQFEWDAYQHAKTAICVLGEEREAGFAAFHFAGLALDLRETADLIDWHTYHLKGWTFEFKDQTYVVMSDGPTVRAYVWSDNQTGRDKP